MPTPDLIEARYQSYLPRDARESLVNKDLAIDRVCRILIDGAPRAASAKAKTACEVAPITEKTFLFLVHETPFFAISVMRALAERLRRATPA